MRLGGRIASTTTRMHGTIPISSTATGPGRMGVEEDFQEVIMGKTGNKRRARKKKKANHGKRPNS